MDINQLEVLIAVAREKSFSRAAEVLGRTQPAVSQAIRRLELEIGEKLFDRSSKDGTLTTSGVVLVDFARHHGYHPKACRPYRAKTKGKVERFNGYLKGSFLVPLAASLEAAGLKLTPEVANAHVRRWLDDVANVRVHATTKAVPATRLTEEQAVMLPAPALKAPPALPLRVAIPIESLQHPLAVYDELLGVAA